MGKLISVIMPIYNREKELKYSVKSIQKQTYQNLEIILVDDGSNDNSLAICKEFAKTDNRIKVVHKENSGVSDTRNIGLDNATGEYICFIDSDDVILDKYCSYMYNIAEKYNADIVDCEFTRISENNIENASNIMRQKNKETNEVIVQMDNIKALYALYDLSQERHDKTVIPCNKLFKKEVFKDLRYPSGRIHEDEATTYKILYNVKKFVETNRYLYGYIQSENSIMRNEIGRERIDNTLISINEAIEFFKDKKMNELEGKAKREYLKYSEILYNNIKQEDNKIYLKHIYNNSYKNWIEFMKRNASKEELDFINKLKPEI